MSVEDKANLLTLLITFGLILAAWIIGLVVIGGE